MYPRLRFVLATVPAVAVFAAAMTTTSMHAHAFTHIVERGDTLASISERYYGRLQNEKLLVAANGLDDKGGSPIVPGMLLEVPALTHHRVKKGETWSELAIRLLGSAHREVVLAQANRTSPWLPPHEGTLIRVPYNLKLIASAGDNIIDIAYKYWGDTNKAWVLDHYNGFKGRKIERGDVVLVPLSDLELTEEGRKASKEAAARIEGQARSPERGAQLKVEAEIPALIADVRAGRFVEAVTRGTRFLGSADLNQQQLATIHRQLLEAYVALEAPGLATMACLEWRKHATDWVLDPVYMSPKVVAACERGIKP